MIKYQVLICGEWVPVDTGILIRYDRLAWWKDGARGIAYRGEHQLAPETIANPDFKAALWLGLTVEEQLEATNRRAACTINGDVASTSRGHTANLILS